MIKYFCDECNKEITYNHDPYFVGRRNDIEHSFCSTKCLKNALENQDKHWPTRRER